MRHYALLRLLIAGVFLYVAWSEIPLALASIEKVFWALWLLLFLLIVGANLGILLQLNAPSIMEQSKEKSRQTLKN